MAQRLGFLKETASQTAGPYVHIGLTPNFCDITGVYPEDLGANMLHPDTKGERVKIRLRVLDGTETPLKDALIEVWQADSKGLYNSPSEKRGQADKTFSGFGRFPTDMTSGEISFETIKPGRVPYPDGRMQAPHLSLWIVARGINLGLHTRLYFADEEAANAEDPLLNRIEQPVRRKTLLACKDGDTYHFDIFLQGEKETVFLDI